MRRVSFLARTAFRDRDVDLDRCTAEVCDRDARVLIVNFEVEDKDQNTWFGTMKVQICCWCASTAAPDQPWLSCLLINYFEVVLYQQVVSLSLDSPPALSLPFLLTQEAKKKEARNSLR
jgi:hypothetical protein